MEAKNIDPNLEIYEVLNAFPVLENTLQEFDINPKDIQEGETVEEFLNKLVRSEEEKKILLRRMNTELNYFFKKGKRPQVSIVEGSNEYIVGEEEE